MQSTFRFPLSAVKKVGLEVVEQLKSTVTACLMVARLLNTSKTINAFEVFQIPNTSTDSMLMQFKL